MSPIPIPMTQAVNINIRRRMFVKAYRWYYENSSQSLQCCPTLTTAPNSGIDLNWLAKTFILSACSFNLWLSFLAVGWNWQILDIFKTKVEHGRLFSFQIDVRAVLFHFCALKVIGNEMKVRNRSNKCELIFTGWKNLPRECANDLLNKYQVRVMSSPHFYSVLRNSLWCDKMVLRKSQGEK